MKDMESARALAETMVSIGTEMGKKTVALLTNMNQPLGRMIGNALEVRESIDILRGHGPADVRELTLELARVMLELADLDPRLATQQLNNGAALQKFKDIVRAQGGDVSSLDDLERLPTARRREPVVAQASGIVTSMDTRGPRHGGRTARCRATENR